VGHAWYSARTVTWNIKWTSLMDESSRFMLSSCFLLNEVNDFGEHKKKDIFAISKTIYGLWNHYVNSHFHHIPLCQKLSFVGKKLLIRIHKALTDMPTSLRRGTLDLNVQLREWLLIRSDLFLQWTVRWTIISTKLIIMFNNNNNNRFYTVLWKMFQYIVGFWEDNKRVIQSEISLDLS